MQSKSEYESEGLPSTLVSSRYHKHIPLAADAAPTPWLMQLDNISFHDLLSNPEKDQKFLTIKTDTKTTPGDLCILTGSVMMGDSSQTRIGALCKVDSPPVHHPYKGQTVAMTILHKMNHSIPLNIEFYDDEKNENQLSKFEGYELDQNAVDSIVHDISEFKSDQEGKIWKELLTQKIA